MDKFIDAIFSEENKLFKRIALIFILITIGIIFGHVWAWLQRGTP